MNLLKFNTKKENVKFGKERYGMELNSSLKHSRGLFTKKEKENPLFLTLDLLLRKVS